MEHINIKFKDFNPLVNRHDDLFSFLDNVESMKLKDFLIDNILNKDGSPSIANLHIVNYKFDRTSNEGNFRLKFNIERQFCCSGVEACAEDYLDFDFNYQAPYTLAHASYFNWVLDN